MTNPNAFTFLMLPPQTATTRQWAARLATCMPELNVVVAEDTDSAASAIANAQAAFGHLPADLLTKANRLQWLQAPQAAPAPGYYYPALIKHPVTVTNFREIYNDHISAHILSFVLAFARGLTVYLRQQQRREWQKPPENQGVMHLPDAVALIVGLGGIGNETARLLAAFGLKVLAVDARRREKPDHVAELHTADQLDTLLPRADFVILTVPHTPSTERFFNRSKFQLMKPTAYFINIGRGMTTPLDDLVAALNTGEIAGAGLDVYEQEPLPLDHPLWGMSNVIMTPHMAGYGPHLNERRFQIILENCAAFAEGRPLRNIVDKVAWF